MSAGIITLVAADDSARLYKAGGFLGYRACSWCGDTAPAGLVADTNGWLDGVCTKHAIEHFGYMLPADFRPVQYATVFKLRMLCATHDASLSGDWETYTSFDALFKASREITRGGAFEQVYASSNSHYRRSGHHRMVFRSAKWPHSVARVIIHVVVK